MKVILRIAIQKRDPNSGYSILSQKANILMSAVLSLVKYLLKNIFIVTERIADRFCTHIVRRFI